MRRNFRFFVTFYAIFRLSHDWPVVSGGGNQSTRQKPPPNHKSLATFSLAPAGIQTLGAIRTVMYLVKSARRGY